MDIEVAALHILTVVLVAVPVLASHDGPTGCGYPGWCQIGRTGLFVAHQTQVVAADTCDSDFEQDMKNDGERYSDADSGLRLW